jgi:hypothetical protein
MFPTLTLVGGLDATCGESPLCGVLEGTLIQARVSSRKPSTVEELPTDVLLTLCYADWQWIAI